MIPPHPQHLYLSSDCVFDISTFFTLLIATLDFTASAYRHTCHRHSLHSYILRQSSPVIIWARLALFYWYNYIHRRRLHYHVAANIAATLYTSHTHQSRRIVTPTLVTLTRLVFPHLSPLPCLFCLSQCRGLRNPLDCHTAVASVTSQSHLSHCLRFLGFVVVHCTDQAIVSVSQIFLYSQTSFFNETRLLYKQHPHLYGHELLDLRQHLLNTGVLKIGIQVCDDNHYSLYVTSVNSDKFDHGDSMHNPPLPEALQVFQWVFTDIPGFKLEKLTRKPTGLHAKVMVMAATAAVGLLLSTSQNDVWIPILLHGLDHILSCFEIALCVIWYSIMSLQMKKRLCCRLGVKMCPGYRP